MSEQRRSFSFKLPWLPAGRPTIFSRTPAGPANQRPPFQPPGSAPVQPPSPQSQGPVRIEPHPSSQRQPPPPPPQSQGPVRIEPHPSPQRQPPPPPLPPQAVSPGPGKSESEPSSPSPTPSQSSATSTDASPTRAEARPQTALQSPSHLASRPEGLTSSSLSPSPPRVATSHAPSPAEKLQSRSWESSPLPPSSIQPLAAAASKEQTKPEMIESSPKMPQVKAEITQSSLMSDPVPAQKSPWAESQEEKPLAESQEELKRNEGEKVASELKKEEETNGPSYKEPMAETDAKLLSAVSSLNPQAGRQVENHETLDTTSAASQEQTKPEIIESSPKKPQLKADNVSEAFSEPDPVPAQKSNSSTSVADEKPVAPVAESQEDSRTEREEIALQLKKEEKVDPSVYKEPVQETAAKLPTAVSSPQPKDHPVNESQAGRQVESLDTLGKLETLITSGSDGKQINAAISTHPKDKETASESHQKVNITNGDQGPLLKEITEDISKIVHRLAIGHQNQPLDGRPVSVITLTGENKGASTQLGSQPVKKEAPIHIYRDYKNNPDDSTGTTSDGEDSSNGRSKNAQNKDPDTKAYINSNIQSINNSLVFDSSVTEGCPGVQVALSDEVTEEKKPDRNLESLEARKSEVSITHAQNLTYEPMARRRCLRSLFLESSDLEPDNPGSLDTMVVYKRNFVVTTLQKLMPEYRGNR